MNKTFKNILKIGCSGLVGVFVTIGYQHFFAQQSFSFYYNGEEVIVTKAEYVDILDENQNLKKQ